MAELATIARPYAEALFRVALPSGLNEWTDLLSRMAQVASVPEFADMASDPRVPRNVVSETFTAALKMPIGEEAKKLRRHAGGERAPVVAAGNCTPVP